MVMPQTSRTRDATMTVEGRAMTAVVATPVWTYLESRKFTTRFRSYRVAGVSQSRHVPTLIFYASTDAASSFLRPIALNAVVGLTTVKTHMHIVLRYSGAHQPTISLPKSPSQHPWITDLILLHAQFECCCTNLAAFPGRSLNYDELYTSERRPPRVSHCPEKALQRRAPR
jgi:hypothetical protein